MEKGFHSNRLVIDAISNSQELIYYLIMYTYFLNKSFLEIKTSTDSITRPNITDIMDITEKSPWGRTLRNPPQCGCVQVNMQLQHSLAPLILSLVDWYIYIYISIYFYIFLNPLTDCLSNPPLKTWVVFFSTEIHLIHKIILCMFFYMSIFIWFFVSRGPVTKMFSESSFCCHCSYLLSTFFYTLHDNETQIHSISSAWQEVSLKKYTGNTPQNVCEEVAHRLQTPAHSGPSADLCTSINQ